MNSSKRKHILVRRIMASWAAAGLLPALALAPYSTSAQQAASTGRTIEPLMEIIVTGSRIARPELDAPSPTTVVDAAAIEAGGITNIVDLLNDLPQIGNGNFNTNTSFSFGNVGLNQLNLRELGVRRTLTLVNGRRRVGTPDDSNFLAVDVGNIPTALIDRVEVMTGGTAAVYGADAVAGVVNIILKDDFEGIEVGGQYGADERGDYDDSSYHLTLGTNYERGNAIFALSHSENARLLRRDRGVDVSDTFVSNPANVTPTDGIPRRIRLDNTLNAFFGIPTITTESDALGGIVIFDPSLNDFRLFDASNSARGVIDGSVSLGPDGGRARFFDTRIAPLRRSSAYVKADYDLTDAVKFTGEVMFTQSKASDVIGPVFDVFSTFVELDNPFMPAATRQRLLDGGEDGIFLSREHREFGTRGADLDRKFFSVALGLEGTMMEDWTWSTTVERGTTNTRNTNINDRLDANWFNAIDAIADPVTGQPICRDSAARAEGCVPVNVFGIGTISDAAIDYVRVREHTTKTDTTQTLAQAVLTGDMFALPAGDVRFVLGAEYRKDELDFRPSLIWEQALGFFASQFSPVRESNDVKEAFSEVLVPVLADVPGVEKLEINGAYRYSDYERAGSVDTWNLGLVWTPVRDVRFRGTKAITVRAPSLGELFDPGSRGAFGLDDPCDPNELDAGTASRRTNCIALGLDPVSFNPNTRRVTTLVFTNGNPSLDVEEADTVTAGFVFQPRWVQGLAIQADWYDIDLSGGIARIGPQQTLDNCVDLPSLNNQFCSFVTRDASGNIQEVRDSYINVSGIKVRGIDFELSYVTSLADLFHQSADWGELRTRLVGNHQDHNIFVDRDLASGEESESDDAGEFNLPEWRGMLSLTYGRDPVDVNWQARWVGSSVTENDTVNPQEDLGKNYRVPSVTYHDMSVGYATPWNVRLRLGVNNVFDEEPRNHPFTSSGALALDDIIGRFFYVSATANFAEKEK